MANKPNIVYALGNRLSTTLDGSITDSATSIDVVDASGMRTSGGYAIIDSENEATREIIYIESISGNTLTIATNGRGVGDTSAVSHSSGVSIKDVIVDDHVNGLATQFEVGHEDDGTHKADSIDTDAIQDDAVTTAKIADDSVTNAKLDTGAGEIGAAWQSWTPSYTNITVGDGTVVAKYIQIGKTIRFEWQIVCGSSTSIANGHTISLPVAANARYGTANVNTAIGTFIVNDINGNVYAGFTIIAASTSVFSCRAIVDAGGSAGVGEYTSTSFPVAEATGDTYTISGTYEAA